MHKILMLLWVYMCMCLSLCVCMSIYAWTYVYVCIYMHICVCTYHIFSKICVPIIQRRVRRREMGLKTEEGERRKEEERGERKEGKKEKEKKRKNVKSLGTWPSSMKQVSFQPFPFTPSNCGTSTIGWWCPIQFMLSVHFADLLPLTCISQRRSQRSNVAGGLRWSLSDSIRAENYSWLKE